MTHHHDQIWSAWVRNLAPGWKSLKTTSENSGPTASHSHCLLQFLVQKFGNVTTQLMCLGDVLKTWRWNPGTPPKKTPKNANGLRRFFPPFLRCKPPRWSSLWRHAAHASPHPGATSESIGKRLEPCRTSPNHAIFTVVSICPCRHCLEIFEDVWSAWLTFVSISNSLVAFLRDHHLESWKPHNPHHIGMPRWWDSSSWARCLNVRMSWQSQGMPRTKESISHVTLW